jgi:glucokinase
LKKLAIGIDIGGTRTKIGLVELNSGEVLSIEIVPTETKNRAYFEESLNSVIDAFKKNVVHTKTQIMGVGVGVSSFVFPNGTVDSTYGFIDFMENYPLAQIIQNTHNLPCLVDNDARLVALGEGIYGKGKTSERVLVLTLGTGLGVGFVKNKQLEDKSPFGHMAGHISITENASKCYCGKTGCLESLVSATGIVEAAKKVNWQPNSKTNSITVEAIFQAKETGDKVAKQIFKTFIENLKIGISNYINIYAPDKIILGGGVAKGLKNYVDLLLYDNLLGPFTTYKTIIEISDLEEYAGVLGAAALFNRATI